MEQPEDDSARAQLAALESMQLTRRESPTTELTRKLLDYLLAGHVRVGERLPSERKLAGVLGTGRSVVREAFKSLELIGIVEVRQGDGTYLRSRESELLPQVIEWGLLLGSKRTHDLLEARLHLEVVLAGLAAERRDEQALADLRRELDRMHAAGGDLDEYTDADVAFHLRIAGAANNDTLYRVMASIRSLLKVWMRRFTSAEGLEAAVKQHDPIYQAIAEGDSVSARRAMEMHMVQALARLEDTFEPD